MIKEYKKIDEGGMPGKPAVIPLNPHELIDVERMQTLEDVNIIKLKYMGSSREELLQMVARKYIYLKEGEGVASPTFSLEGFFIALVIGALKRR